MNEKEKLEAIHKILTGDDLHHNGACSDQNQFCWRDAEGAEWHRGNYTGVYRWLNNEQTYFDAHSRGNQ